METSIKDLILSDETVIEARHKPKKAARKPACYEVVTVSGPDFAVRKKGIKNSSLLVCICSKGQFYVKNESSGEHEPLDAQGLMRFLGDAPKDSGLELSDKDGNTPFWIRTLERTKDFSENFMAAVGDETLRQYFCRNMLSFSGISDYIEQDRKKKYYRPCCSNLKNLDFKRAKLVFESAAEHYPREELKEGMAEFLEQKNSGKKIGSMFQIMLRTAEQHSHHFRWRNTRTVYDWLFDNWGVEGVKQFIRTYLETPVSYMADAFESSINIQQTSFSLAEFLDYCFCEWCDLFPYKSQMR